MYGMWKIMFFNLKSCEHIALQIHKVRLFLHRHMTPLRQQTPSIDSNAPKIFPDPEMQ